MCWGIFRQVQAALRVTPYSYVDAINALRMFLRNTLVTRIFVYPRASGSLFFSGLSFCACTEGSSSLGVCALRTSERVRLRLTLSVLAGRFKYPPAVACPEREGTSSKAP